MLCLCGILPDLLLVELVHEALDAGELCGLQAVQTLARVIDPLAELRAGLLIVLQLLLLLLQIPHPERNIHIQTAQLTLLWVLVKSVLNGTLLPT